MNSMDEVLLHEFIDILLVAVLILDLLIVATRKLKSSVWMNASQAALLGLMPLLLTGGELEFHVVLMSVAILVVRGLVIPFVLLRSVRSAPVSVELRSLVDQATAVSLAAVLFGLSFALGINLPLPAAIPHFSDLLVPTALTTIMIGLLLLVIRTQALMQVIGYLTIENGIFLIGLALVRETPVVVELGILLDVFVGVFVMGIVLFHISQAFEHLDTTELSSLRD
ncbi:hydrogenase [bacterium]|nr:hydrogenase [bacterium]